MSQKYGLLAASVVALTGLFTIPARPNLAAENVVLTMGETQLVTVPVSDLEIFAQTGTVPESLSAFTDLVNEQEQAAVRDALNDPIEVKPAPFNQFLQSNLGELILEGFGGVFKPDGSTQSAKEALQTAMTTAATSGSFRIIDLAKNYPTSNLIIDAEPVLNMIKEGKTLGSDVKLLLAGFGVDIDTSNLKFDLNSLRTLFDSTKSYAQEVDTFVTSTGVTVDELKGPTPPTGTVTIEKAELYQLYQKLDKLVQEAKAATGINIK